MKRYYVANSDGLPLSNQQNNGYTYLQVIERVQREIEECVKLFSGEYSDYIEWFEVLDNNFDIVNDAKQAF